MNLLNVLKILRGRKIYFKLSRPKMCKKAGITSDTAVFYNPERTGKAANRLLHNLSRKRSRRTWDHWMSNNPPWPNCWTAWSKKARHVIHQQRILVLSTSSRDAHLVLRPELLESYQQVESGVRDPHPAAKNSAKNRFHSKYPNSG